MRQLMEVGEGEDLGRGSEMGRSGGEVRWGVHVGIKTENGESKTNKFTLKYRIDGRI